MRRRTRNMPSASMVVAFTALLLALGGTAVALPGSNTVTSGDIVRGGVRSSDIKNNSVRSGDIRNSTIRGKDVRNGTLRGADINEGSLGTVPSANTANSADTANSANNANNLGGTPAGAFVQATNFAYGEIDPTGAVKASPPNRNIVSVSRPLTGVYCIQLAFTPTFGDGGATGQSSGGTVVQVDIPATNCPAGTEATAYVIDGANASANDDFTVLFGSF